jgi:hypothetical protein
MKKVILILLTFVVGGCSYDDNGKMIASAPLQVIVYDDCEYVYGDYRLAHKGNCKFCERRRLNQDSVATKTYAEIIKMHKEAQ